MARNLDTGMDEEIVPLTRELNFGYTCGWSTSVICGWREDRNMHMVWDRHTGEVKAFSKHRLAVIDYVERT